jgi:hypothetical protein
MPTEEAQEAGDDDVAPLLAAVLADVALTREEPLELAPLAHAAHRRLGLPPEAAADAVRRAVTAVLDEVDTLLAADGIDGDVLRAARAAELDDLTAHVALARALQRGRADGTLEAARAVVAAAHQADQDGPPPGALGRAVRRAAFEITAQVDAREPGQALAALAALAPQAGELRSASLAAELLEALRPLGDPSLVEPR